MKRIVLFLATNLAVMLVLSIVLDVLGVGRAVSARASMSAPCWCFRWWWVLRDRSFRC